MSELKYYKLFHRASALTSPEFISVVEFGTDDEIYLKSEADKVIAEKDAEIAQLQAMLEERNKQVGELKEIDSKNRSAYYKDLSMMARDVEHHKYKRCLDKTEMCKARYDVENINVNGHRASWDYTESKEMKYWERWSKRWLELAEKFKERK